MLLRLLDQSPGFCPRPPKATVTPGSLVSAGCTPEALRHLRPAHVCWATSKLPPLREGPKQGPPQRFLGAREVRGGQTGWELLGAFGGEARNPCVPSHAAKSHQRG